MNQRITKFTLSYDVASGSDITPYNKIDKQLVVCRFSGNVMMYIRGGIQKSMDKLNIFFMHYRILTKTSHFKHS